MIGNYIILGVLNIAAITWLVLAYKQRKKAQGLPSMFDAIANLRSAKFLCFVAIVTDVVMAI